MQRAEASLSTELMHIPFVVCHSVKSTIYSRLLATYMWISLQRTVTMAVVFATPAFDLGDIRVSGTLAAVRGAFAR